jgi:hypothetical protein
MVRSMNGENPRIRTHENMHRSNSADSNFNTRVFWIAYFLSIVIFFAWLSQ